MVRKKEEKRCCEWEIGVSGRGPLHRDSLTRSERKYLFFMVWAFSFVHARRAYRIGRRRRWRPSPAEFTVDTHMIYCAVCITHSSYTRLCTAALKWSWCLTESSLLFFLLHRIYVLGMQLACARLILFLPYYWKCSINDTLKGPKSKSFPATLFYAY